MLYRMSGIRNLMLITLQSNIVYTNYLFLLFKPVFYVWAKTTVHLAKKKIRLGQEKVFDRAKKYIGAKIKSMYCYILK